MNKIHKINLQLLPTDILPKIFIHLFSSSKHFNAVLPLKQIIKKNDIELLRYILNNINIEELNKSFTHDLATLFDTIGLYFDKNNIIEYVMKQRKLEMFQMVNSFLPDYNQITTISDVYEYQLQNVFVFGNTIKIIEWISKNPNKKGLKMLKNYNDINNSKIDFAEYMDIKFRQDLL